MRQEVESRDLQSPGSCPRGLHCLDYDKDAIEYSFNAKRKGLLNNIEFCRDNALKFRPAKQYDLIWSSEPLGVNLFLHISR
jgi:hypothetical protein